MSRSLDVLLADMREAAERALRHVEGMSKDQFQSDEKTVDAVVRCLSIIGEAAKRVSQEDRAARNDLPWREMTGLRDRVVHDYLGVDLEIVWEVVSQNLPELVRAL